jgi:hypothetical protein
MTQSTTIRNFPKQRYKLGKQKKGISLADFTKILEAIDVLAEQKNYYVLKYDALKIKSALACFYWTGLRKTEVCGGFAKRYVLPPCKRHALPIERRSPAFPGMLKENIQVDNEWIFITAPPRKQGSREAPL